MMLMEAPRFGATFEEVLAAAQAGAGWAFERLYRWLSPSVLSYLRGQGMPDPEDLVGDVFMRAFHNVDAFRGTEEQFRSWVFTMAHHRVVDERRRLARRPVVDSQLEAVRNVVAREDTEAAALASIAADGIRAVIEDLPPDQRDVLLMRVLGDLTIEQAGDALGKSRGAIKQLQRRALLTVRRCIEKTSVTL